MSSWRGPGAKRASHGRRKRLGFVEELLASFHSQGWGESHSQGARQSNLACEEDTPTSILSTPPAQIVGMQPLYVTHVRGLFPGMQLLELGLGKPGEDLILLLSLLDLASDYLWDEVPRSTNTL